MLLPNLLAFTLSLIHIYHIKLERRWAHNLAHNASDAGFTTVGEKLHAAMQLLDEVRATLDDAKDALDEDAENASGVTVNLV